jgi:hypothetical protein
MYKGSFFLSLHATHRQDRWLYYALALAWSGWFPVQSVHSTSTLIILFETKLSMSIKSVQTDKCPRRIISSSPCGLWSCGCMTTWQAKVSVRLRPPGNFQIRMSRNLCMCAPKSESGRSRPSDHESTTHGHVRTHCFPFVASFAGAGWYYNTSKHYQLRKRILF